MGDSKMFSALLSRFSINCSSLLQKLYINSAAFQAAHCTEREWQCPPPLTDPPYAPQCAQGCLFTFGEPGVVNGLAKRASRPSRTPCKFSFRVALAITCSQRLVSRTCQAHV